MSDTDTSAAFTPGWRQGGCHCGLVRFQVYIHRPEALRCNCSICAMKGFINLITGDGDFELLLGQEHLREYRFNTGQARHFFCGTCGIHPFTRPRSHPDGYDVNARCLDDGFDYLQITDFDGQNWEDSVASIQ